MNIFEQYGIQEVADCTLYSIELDENDDEVYVPILYFDTLKISTLEGTSEQVSARGGLGNPKLITWDYGKEISVSLQDALYTPASQSLTWGGQYGSKNFEIYGDYTRYNYKLNDYGYHIYLDNDGNPLDPTDESNAETIAGLDAKIIIESFSGFENYKFETLTTEEWDCYRWIVNIKMLTDDGEDRYVITDKMHTTYSSVKNQDMPLVLIYREASRKYTFSFVESVSENSKGEKTYTLISEEVDDLTFYKKTKNKAGETVYVKMGVFTLSEEKNSGIVPPQEAIYQIKSGLENVYYLDRMEKCRATQTFCIDADVNTTHYNYSLLEQYAQCELVVYIDPKTMKPYEPNTDIFYRKNGEVISGRLRVIKQYEIYYKWTRTKALDYTSLGSQIIVDAVHFPGTYRLVGETYSRSRKTGKDHRYQFEIPLCKMSADTNLTLEAGGDPTTFDMTLDVLRREDGVMMKLTQYSVENTKYDDYLSDSTSIVPIDEVVPETPKTGSD